MSFVYRNGRRGLCCECGNLRKIDGRSNAGYHVFEFHDGHAGRMTCSLKCAICGRHTTHAIIRHEDDEDRDEAENGRPDSLARSTDAELIDEVRARIRSLVAQIPASAWSLEDAYEVLTVLKRIAGG